MSRKLPKIIPHNHVIKLLRQPNRKAPTGLRNYCMIAVMYRAGLRVSEVCGLTQNQIDWQEGQLRIMGKGNKERVVPLEPWVLDTFADWKKIKPRKSKTFFCTLDGGKIQRRYINALLERYSSRAGIDRVNPHALRHTYATGMLGDGFNIREVQQALGHENLNTTMIYTHVNPIELRDKIRVRRMSWDD